MLSGALLGGMAAYVFAMWCARIKREMRSGCMRVVQGRTFDAYMLVGRWYVEPRRGH